MKDSSQKIIEKIQKLLAMTSSPNEAEAMTAMKMAQELLQKHDLEVADVKARIGGQAEPDESVGQEEVPNGMRTAPAWHGWILSGLAKANNCQSYSQGGSFYLIGKPHRVAVVKSLFSYLLDTVEREQKAAMVKAKGDPMSEPNRYGTQRYSWRKWSTDFKQGMASRIHKRLAEQAKVCGSGQVSALAVQNQATLARQEIDAWMRSNGMRLTRRTTHTRNSSGYGAGQSAGDRVGLNSQLGGGSGSSRRMLSGR